MLQWRFFWCGLLTYSTILSLFSSLCSRVPSPGMPHQHTHGLHIIDIILDKLMDIWIYVAGLQRCPCKGFHYNIVISWKPKFSRFIFYYQSKPKRQPSSQANLVPVRKGRATLGLSLGARKYACISLPLMAATVTRGKVRILPSNFWSSSENSMTSGAEREIRPSRSSPREKCLPFPIVTIATASS